MSGKKPATPVVQPLLLDKRCSSGNKNH